MSDVRYVILSDMHLGQDQSILTDLVAVADSQSGDRLVVAPMSDAPALRYMVDILADVIGHNQGPEKPVLVLLGDIIELALTEMHISTMVFERFARLLQRDGELLFSKVIFVPGNHDHHLWETARGNDYALYLAQAALDEQHTPARHTTSLVEGLPHGEPLMRALIRRALSDRGSEIEVECYYPNVALTRGDRAVLLHHGHFTEAIYRAMSTLAGKLFPEQKLPTSIELWEKENFAWIDFFWSALGRQGIVGADVERIYDIMDDPDKLERLSEQLAETLVDGWHPGTWYGKVEKLALEKALPYLLRHLFSKFEHERSSSDPSQFPGQELLAGLRAYIDGPLVSQVRRDLGSVPSTITFVFGHTHQPFERIWDAGPLGDAIELYNTGGWAVDPSPDIQPHMGGAAVLLDNELNAASLRFFNQAKDPAEYRVSVRTADPDGNLLCERLAAIIDNQREPYKSFRDAAAAAISRRFEVVRQVEDGERTGTQQAER